MLILSDGRQLYVHVYNLIHTTVSDTVSEVYNIMLIILLFVANEH